jgi:hypothetical protein
MSDLLMHSAYVFVSLLLAGVVGEKMPRLHLVLPIVGIAEEFHDTPRMDDETLQINIMQRA